MDARKLRSFQNAVWRHYKKEGRHDLPWRKTRDPYRILVSEVMLQQTQVERVVPYYRAWIEEFPNVDALSRAPLSAVLRAWQGLGYNRRAKMLREASLVLAPLPRFPKEVKTLESLPGVGRYTARAIAAFAFNQDVTLVETNIRTAVMHHFFPRARKVSDARIETILMKAHPKGRAREWYAALMDYGAHLKRSGIRTNARVKGYAKQSRFRGSTREIRGALLRELARGVASHARLEGLMGIDRVAEVRTQITRLVAEGFIKKQKGYFALPE